MDWLSQYLLLVLGGIFASMWLFAAVILKLNRFSLYAAFTFAGFGVAQFKALPFWMTFVILGGLIAFTGILLLIRFVQQYPIAE